MNANLTLSKTSAQATSTWKGWYSMDGSIGYTTPTWDYDSITVTVPAALTGAVFNGVTLTLNRNTASGSAYVRFADTKEDVTNTRILARLRKGDSKFTLQFGFKATGGSGSVGEHSSTARWWGTAYGSPITISVDYLPASAVSGTVSFSGSSVFYSIKQTSLQLSESGNIVLAVTPSAAATAIRVDIRPHGQTNYISRTYSMSAAANTQTSFGKVFDLDGLIMDHRVAKADLRFALTTASGTQTSSWAVSQLTLVRERLAPVITAIGWTDASGTADIYGGMVQSKSNASLTISVQTDTEADPDIALMKRVLTYGGTQYTSGNNTFAVGILDAAGAQEYTVSITDSYGNTGTASGTLYVTPYTPSRLTQLSVERYVTRQSESGASYDVLDDDGVKVWVTLTGSVSPVGGKNAYTVSYRYSGTSHVILSGSDGGTFAREKDKGLIPLEFSALEEHEITVSVADAFGTAYYTVILPKAGAILSIEAGGVGIGKRCTADRDNPELQIVYPIKDAGGYEIASGEIALAEHPVGRFLGKVMYRKAVNIAALSTDSASPTQVSVGIAPTRIINIAGFVRTNSYGDLPVNCYHSAAIRAFARPNGLTGKLTAYCGTACANSGAVFIVDYLKD